MSQRPSALYVHIPFCREICHYCDFPKGFYRSDVADRYLDVLIEETKGLIGPFSTIYVGGGTPSALSPAQIERLLSALSPFLLEGGEFCFELNPESIDTEKARILRKYGVNRVSMGVESGSPRLLSLMGRKHGRAEAIEAVRILREAGITNINLDLIYGLPDETVEELDADIDFLLSFDVPHLSTYSLSVSPNTLFYLKAINEQADEGSAAFYERILSRLREHGYCRYEVSNFAKPGYESKHNLAYWKDLPYVGLGLGAAGYENGRHYQNTKSLNRYLKEGGSPVYEEEPDRQGKIEYFLLTNLRLAKGFADEEFKKRFGKSFIEEFGEKARKAVDDGLLEIGEGIRPTDRGLILLDRLLLALY